jgi:hypothetical protein
MICAPIDSASRPVGGKMVAPRCLCAITRHAINRMGWCLEENIGNTERTSTKSSRGHQRSMTGPSKGPKLSRTHAPAGLAPEDWQRGLRRQFGREQAFGLENLGDEPFFSEFRATSSSAAS